MKRDLFESVHDRSDYNWINRTAGKILEGAGSGDAKINRSLLFDYERSYRQLAKRKSLSCGAGVGPTAAYLRLLVCTGRLAQAVKIVVAESVEFCLERDTEASDSERAVFLSIVAEIFLLSGQIREAASHARLSIEYGKAGEVIGYVRYSGAVLAAAMALNGEIARAKEILVGLHTWIATEPWKADARAWSLLLALILTQSRGRGAEVMEENAHSTQNWEAEGIVQATYAYGECVTALSRGEFEKVVEVAGIYRHRVDYPAFPELLSNLIVGAEALALSHLGYPGQVLSLLSDCDSPTDHTVCFELLQANAYIQLGKPREALQITADCVKIEPLHSLATLPSMLLRRAVAYELLQQHESADREYSKATRLAYSANSITPVLGLPLAVVERLFSRFSKKEPEIGEKILAAMSGRVDFPTVETTDRGYCSLTKRELVLLEELASGKTFVTIAKDLSLSVNTLKTQSRSIYSKLGVSSREAAVDVMTKLGFF